MWLNALLVSIGGGLGSFCRYALSIYAANWSLWFPFGTFLANLLACFILGCLTGLSLKNNLSTNYNLLLGTGFCGGFSTFSTFSKECLQLLQAGNLGQGFAYLSLSIILGLLMVYLGILLVK